MQFCTSLRAIRNFRVFRQVFASRNIPQTPINPKTKNKFSSFPLNYYLTPNPISNFKNPRQIEGYIRHKNLVSLLYLVTRSIYYCNRSGSFKPSCSNFGSSNPRHRNISLSKYIFTRSCIYSCSELLQDFVERESRDRERGEISYFRERKQTE